MGGISWTLEEHQKWLTSWHECTWFGIVCNDNKEVTGIELWNLGLEGPIPKEIMSLTNLERLSMPENNIQGELPVDAFFGMKKLTDLTLFMNSISGGIDSRIFESATRLVTLNLDSNSLTGSVPTEVGKLDNLVQLKLSRNNFEGPIPSELGKIPTLKRIELSENNLYGTIPTEIGQLVDLESVNLSWNDLQGPIPQEFKSLRNLQDLILKSNDLGGTLPELITVYGKLENLILSLNEFSGQLPSQMHLMSSLSKCSIWIVFVLFLLAAKLTPLTSFSGTVHLEQNKLEGTIPAALSSCSFLRDLRLDHNSMIGPVPTQIGKLAWLSKYEINKSKLRFLWKRSKRSHTFFTTVSLSLEGNSFTGTMPVEVCGLRGQVGTLTTLTATCAAESTMERQNEVFVMPTKDFICAVPDCCTKCEPR